MMTTTPRLYVGTYHKYACGSLKGKWIDLTEYDDVEDFLETCRELHSDERGPELMFQDYEGIPSALYHESMNEEELQKILDYIQLCEDNDQNAINAFLEVFSEGDYDDLVSDFEDKYIGEFDDAEDFGRHFAEAMVEENLPDDLAMFFDYERYGEDLLISDYCEHDGFYFSLR